MPPNTSSEKPINPNVDLGIPKWINADYFQHILEQDVPNFSKVTNFTPVAATAPGENYTSVMVRVLIDVEMKDGASEKRSYILKTGLDSANNGAALVNSLNLFPKEKQMYQVILPQFEKLYADAGVNIQFGPKCLHIEETPENITLIMEDLQRRKFVNKDRLQGFDMAHITRVLGKLAELHAASAVYRELNGPYDDIYHKSFFTEGNRKIFEDMSTARDMSYKRAMRDWGLENVEYYISKMTSLDEFFDEAIRINATDPNEFNVLNHGDCWSNNIMFNYKENTGDIDETLLVDFQVGKWGTPAQDLWYMIVTSASMDIKVKEFDHFVYIYHQRLLECLKLLKYTKAIPSLKQLHMMMLKYGYWGFLTANGVMTAVLFPSDKDANMDNMLKNDSEGEEFRYKTFSNPYYAKAMCQLYPFFANKGVLDITTSKS